MRLKSLELNGFKSFASKAVFEFPKGVTAIVGPNGSGKSNIIDAIRWLLGEREAKNLRGEKIENLIFNGTPKRPRVAMAQVGLNFENDNEKMLELGAEISMIRRVSRDSNPSQYFLNKSEIRLKDAVDFFAKIKLGTKGLAIINQGASDLFVRVTPEERRAMIEEVLGLREYQIKKADAERKLKNTDINLEKVRAMLQEVLPHLRMLKRQTVKWEKRAQVAEELKQMENDYFSFKISEIEIEKEKLGINLRELEEKISVKNREFSEASQEVKNLEKKSASSDNLDNFEGIKKQKNELHARHLKIQKELSRLEAKAEMLQAQNDSKPRIVDSKIENKNGGVNKSAGELIILINEIKSSLNNILDKEPEEAILDVKKIIERINIFLKVDDNHYREENIATLASLARDDRQEIENNKQILLREISVIENDLKKIEQMETEIAAGWQDFNSQFQKAFEKLEEKRKELGAFDYQKQRIIFDREKLEMRWGDLKNQIEQAERTLDEIANYKSQPVNLNQENLLEAERRMFRLRAELASIGEIDAAVIKEAEETEKHFNFLSGQIGDLEKSSADLKILIVDLKEKIHHEFLSAFNSINDHFNKYFHLMFGGGSAKLKIQTLKVMRHPRESGDPENNQTTLDSRLRGNDNENDENQEEKVGVEIDLNLPKKKITDLDMLSGGEKSLVSIAALFALISVSPPPFLVLDEIDAPLDEKNSRRFADLVKEFSGEIQFVIVTHNRSVMEIADVLYGITMTDDGVSKVVSLKLEEPVIV